MATGSKSGGRVAGTPNLKNQVQAIKIKDSGLTPLDYMISVMRDDKQEQWTRLDAAKAAAPYVHPKLANIEHGNLNNVPFYVQLLSSDNDL